jgi:penicillin-binding protein 1A
MALGAGAVTPLQMASAYSVFANGGYRTNPLLITRITDSKGRVLQQSPPPAIDESMRVIDARNAFVMSQLLGEVARSGTAAKVYGTFKRMDLAGKTGTTNDSMDAWFAGYQPNLAAVVWIGYDNPRKLGDRETGGGLALPVWIEYMNHALRTLPVRTPEVPAGLVQQGGDWVFDEFSGSAGVSAVGLDDKLPQAPSEDEKRGILDLFRR